MLPGTELAFADDVKYDNRWIWTKTINFRVGKFGEIEPDVPHRHHDAIEFPDGSHVLVTQLCEGQRVTVLQLPVPHRPADAARPAAERPAATSISRLTDDQGIPAGQAGGDCASGPRRDTVGGQQDHMATGGTGDRAGPIHVQVRLAHGHGGRSCGLERSFRMRRSRWSGCGECGNRGRISSGAFELRGDHSSAPTSTAPAGRRVTPPPADRLPTASRPRARGAAGRARLRLGLVVACDRRRPWPVDALSA